MGMLQATLRKARAAMSGFTPGQLAVIVVGVLGVVVAGLFFMRMSAAPMSPLYSNLSSTDASAVVQELDASGTPYELTDGGATILVAQDKVYATRLAMSGKGLPAQTQDGYALLDKQGITTSEFMQNVTYQRAVEGELAQTIQAIDGVQTATVHLAMPEKSVFTQDSEKPSASVMVSMRPGVTLDSGQVTAITNLVASSVPKLAASAVTVADSTGTLLTSGAGTGMASSSQTQAQQRMETQLASAAQTMLDNVVGTGNAAVRVHADLDFDQRETKTQSYQYTPGTPPIQSTSSTETYTGSGSVPGGVVGATGTGTTTTGTGTGSSNQYNKTGSSATNAVGSTVETRTGAPGTVKRLTVAVLLNANAQNTNTQALQSLVANAVGLDLTRGDTIQLTPMAFDSSAKDAAAAELSAAADAQGRAALFDLIKKVLIALLVIAVIVMAFISGRRQRRAVLDDEELAAIGFAQPLSLTRGESDLALVGSVVAAVPEEPRAIEAATAEIQELVAKQPDEVAQLLRGWIATGR